MPYISQSQYRAPVLFENGHISTIYSAILKGSPAPKYQRERWELPDGDFLLVDFRAPHRDRAVILCHGLEGHSKSYYNNNIAHYFLQKGYAVFAWNNRSCGGEMNRLPQFYHHASVEDLDAVVQRILSKGFKEVYLLGFSLGGAQILSYLGRKSISQKVKAGMAISTPVQLASSAHRMKKRSNRIYRHRFIKRIKSKLMTKAKSFPHLFSRKKIKEIHTFEDLICNIIVPFHDFKDLSDYYKRASPGFSIASIKTPVLLLNARNDPILGQEAYPASVAKQHPYLFLETPQWGGHCSFLHPQKTCSFLGERAQHFFTKKKFSPPFFLS